MARENIRFPQAFLFQGKDLKLTDYLSVRHPSYQDVLSLGDGVYSEELYWAFVQIILADPYENMVWLDDRHMDYEEVSPFQVFVLKWLESLEHQVRQLPPGLEADFSPESLVQGSLSFFLGEHHFKIGQVDSIGTIIYAEDDPRVCLDKDIYELFASFVKELNCITYKDRINPATKSAKRILIEDTRDEQKKAARRKKPQEDPQSYLVSCAAAMVYGGVGGITPFNYSELKLYPMIYGAMVVQKRMRVASMMNGICTGMLDGSKLSEEDLRWTSV